MYCILSNITAVLRFHFASGTLFSSNESSYLGGGGYRLWWCHSHLQLLYIYIESISPWCNYNVLCLAKSTRTRNYRIAQDFYWTVSPIKPSYNNFDEQSLSLTVSCIYPDGKDSNVQITDREYTCMYVVFTCYLLCTQY